ncbi:hypothetical protein LCGC14_0613200 [marine sediment metagenome]|uniref:Uncharacterized protein n=1 Tax=marine sediment metagenome TaxID=412755 RepID=A0A0F9UFN5_9ZZZZ
MTNGKPEELEAKAKAAAAKEQEEKPLPAMVSPTVNLAIEIREAIALRCRDIGESFSLVTNKMWLKLLKTEKRVKADLNPDFSAKRAGVGAKEKLEKKDTEIADLKKQIADLLAAKK